MQNFSTTQLSSSLGILVIAWNVYARLTGSTEVVLSQEEMIALGTLALPAVNFGYVMWRRTKKSTLKWGIIRQ